MHRIVPFVLLLPLACAPTPAVPAAPVACDAANGGLALPDGFCAAVVAESLGPVRQLVVSPAGVLYGAIREAEAAAGVVAFADADGDGRYEARAAFGPPGGNDVKVHDGHLYYALRDRVVRWPLPAGGLAPGGEPELVVGGLPADGGHVAKSIAFLGDTMIVNVGSRSNSCQQQDRRARSPGHEPCAELERRAGLWAFDASTPGQQYRAEARWATGLRNAMALARHPASGTLYMAVHGRDQLAQNWDYPAEVSAEDPAEEFGAVARGDDYGWPYCYESTVRGAKIRAPEYGGDGTSTEGCAQYRRPAIAFPGHWAPMALAWHDGTGFGEAWEGMFLAMHGSWNRAPLPQQGFRVVFIPFEGGGPAGPWDTFAVGAQDSTGIRPAGVAVAPDGALFISDDRDGRIWRIVRR